MRRLGIVLASAVWLLAQSPAGMPASWALIASYARSAGPYHDVTLTAAEANRYFAGPGAARLPAGISQVVLAAEPGVLSGTALVDFDQLAKTGNPLLQMFSGEHRLAVRARVDSAQAPRAQLTVTEVRLDGAVVPNWLLDAAARAFLQPKYPTLGRHFSVPLPRHASGASVGDNAVVLHYPNAGRPAQGAGRVGWRGPLRGCAARPACAHAGLGARGPKPALRGFLLGADSPPFCQG